MDLSIFDQDKELNLLKQDINTSNPYFIVRDFIKGFYVKDTVTVKNTGNIPVMVQKYGEEENHILDVEKDIKFYVDNRIYLMFDAGDVARNLKKFPISSDGKNYLHFRRKF